MAYGSGAARAVASSALLALLSGSRGSPAAETPPAPPSCAPAELSPEVVKLPPAWRKAMEALAAATAREGLPWSCPGGSLSLTLEPGGWAVLLARDGKGRETSRPVETPADVGPTGKALLAGAVLPAPPLLPEPPVEEVPPPPAPRPSRPPRAHPAPEPATPSLSEPRFLLGLAAGPRVSGPSPTAWLSAALRAVVPFGRWSLGLWTRGDLPVTVSDQLAPTFEMTSISVGLSGARSFPLGPIELSVMLDPSLAIVGMEAGQETDPQHPEGDRVVFRAGTGVAASLPLAYFLRGVLSLDAELTPASIAGMAPIKPGFPEVPAYTLGLSLGVETVVR